MEILNGLLFHLVFFRCYERYFFDDNTSPVSSANEVKVTSSKYCCILKKILKAKVDDKIIDLKWLAYKSGWYFCSLWLRPFCNWPAQVKNHQINFKIVHFSIVLTKCRIKLNFLFFKKNLIKCNDIFSPFNFLFLPSIFFFSVFRGKIINQRKIFCSSFLLSPVIS